jgi:hypothetical protein
MSEYAPKTPTAQPTSRALTRVGRPSSSDVDASSASGLDSQHDAVNGHDRMRDLAQLQRRLNQGPRVSQLRHLSKKLQKTGAPRRTIQRKVGFEFEATSGWEVTGRTPEESRSKKITDTKRPFLMGPNDLGGLSSDNGHAEWVSVPLSTWDEVVLAHDDFNTLIAWVRSAPQHKLVLSGADRSLPANYAEVAFKGSEGDVHTKPQATLGVAAAAIPALFEHLLTLERLETPRSDKVAAAAKGIANQEITNAIPEAVDRIPALIADLSRQRGQEPDAETAREAAGFVMILFKTIADARQRPAASEDPKYAFPMMPRTDFKSMLASLADRTQLLLAGLWADGRLGEEIVGVLGYQLSNPLFVKGYKAPHVRPTGGNARSSKVPTEGPTIQEWLASVFEDGQGKDLLAPPPGSEGVQRKDLLSPPPGFPRHDETPEPEGLGAMGTDRDNPKLLLFELRQLTERGECKSSQWLAIMTAFAKITGTVTGDRSLLPPDKSAQPAPPRSSKHSTEKTSTR